MMNPDKWMLIRQAPSGTEVPRAQQTTRATFAVGDSQQKAGGDHVGR